MLKNVIYDAVVLCRSFKKTRNFHGNPYQFLLVWKRDGFRKKQDVSIGSAPRFP